MTDAYTLGLTFSTDELNDALSDLEAYSITTSDIISLEPNELAKRANVPPTVLADLKRQILAQLHAKLKPTHPQSSSSPLEIGQNSRPLALSTLDPHLDTLLAGGLRPGFVHEIVGPSGGGKTQWLLSFLLTSQIAAPHGLSRPSLYISTEHPLPTQRLEELIANNPVLKSATPQPSLNQILTLNATDLEVQDHILNFQLPVVLERHKIGVVVIDSITANYRGDGVTERSGGVNQGKALSDRSAELIKLGTLLRGLAKKFNCVIVCANQVADRLDAAGPRHDHQYSGRGHPNSQQLLTSSPDVPSSSPHPNLALLPSSPAPHNGHPTNELSDTVMSLDHQQRWFTGWGDSRPGRDWKRRAAGGSTAKVPALGMIWSNQIGCRVALYKQVDWVSKRPNVGVGRVDGEGLGAEWSARRFRRWARVVWAPWVEESREDETGVEFEVWAGGLRGVGGREVD